METEYDMLKYNNFFVGKYFEVVGIVPKLLTRIFHLVSFFKILKPKNVASVERAAWIVLLM